MANLFVEGPASIGEDNVFFPYSTVGVAPQDLKLPWRARGNAHRRPQQDPRIRHHPPRHRGGGLVTSIGSDNLLMAYTHVAHDVRIGDHVIIGTAWASRGRDYRRLGGREPYSGVHQFCRLGRHAFIGPYSVVKQDVLRIR